MTGSTHGRLTVAALAACLLAVAAPLRAEAPGARTVGTLRVAGPVETSLDDATWEPTQGGQLREGAVLRTDLGGSATLELAGGDVIRLGEGARLRVRSAVPPALELDEGRAELVLEPGSVTTLDTPGGIVRLPLGAPSAGPERQVVVVASANGTSVGVRRGDVTVLERGGGTLTLAEGQEASLAPGAAGADVTMVGALDEADADGVIERHMGNPGSDPRLRPSPLQAEFWVAIAVIGGGMILSLGML
jgi:hypothetical protein